MRRRWTTILSVLMLLGLAWTLMAIPAAAQDLRFRLDENAADLRQTPAEVLTHLVLGRDRIGEKIPRAGGDGGLRDRLITFHQLLGHIEVPVSIQKE